MTTVAIERINRHWPGYAGAVTLIAESYPVGSAVTDQAFLEWSLGGWNSPGVVAHASDGDGFVGFAGASPRILEAHRETLPAFIVSFVAVAPRARGRGVARALYAELLGFLAREHPNHGILTFAYAGSAGAALIEECYPRAGFSGCEFDPMPPWGIMRRRIGGAVDLTTDVEPMLAVGVARDAAARGALRADPRVVGETDRGVRVSQVDITGSPETLGIVDTWPVQMCSRDLSDALHLAATALPPSVSRIVLPGLPRAAETAARQAGLRQLPGQVYRSWLWGPPVPRPVRTCLVPIT